MNSKNLKNFILPIVLTKGKTSWNKGIKAPQISLGKIGHDVSNESRKKMSETRKRLFKEGKISAPFKNKKLSEEHKKKLSLSHIGLLKGEKSPSWQGGISFEEYGINWNNKFKNIIRKRDNQICMICGIHREKLSRSLDVHHIDYNKKLSIPENCMSLCHHCHLKTNWNRKYWKEMLQSLMKDRYNYSYDYINIEVLK